MYEYQAVVRDIHDGDTFRADVDLGFGMWLHNESFRLNGLNAPELSASNPAGRTSRLYLVGVMPIGTTVTIRTIKDKREKYGRMLAEIYLENGDCINAMMVSSGFAKVWDGKGERPV